MKEGKSYIKDTADFLDRLKDLGEVPEGAILVTADVIGLYHSIPHTEGVEVLRKQYDKFLHKKAPTEDIIKMSDFALKNNFFEFNSKCFQQISGTAIGTKFAPPPYACFFMDYIETEFLKTRSIKPWVWKRFIDDVFLIWTNSEENLERFLKELNGFHPSIKFTFQKSKMKVNFLNVVIKIKNGRLSTDLYSKPVDSHQYLHYNSCHPEHIKKSIIYSQTLRLRRRCSERKDLKSHVRDLKGWFLRRGYPEQIIEEQVDRAFRLPLENGTQ